jgi:hypothetical protein
LFLFPIFFNRNPTRLRHVDNRRDRQSAASKAFCSTYSCGICSEFATDPMEACFNGHVLCGECYKDSQCLDIPMMVCPTCRSSLFFPNEVEKERIRVEMMWLRRVEDLGNNFENYHVRLSRYHFDRSYASILFKFKIDVANVKREGERGGGE